MKKVLAILLALAMVLAFAACGKEPEKQPEKDPEPEKLDPNKKSESVLTFAQYSAVEKGKPVVIEGYVQAVQSYWKGATLYLADGDGAYFVYCSGKEEVPDISEADYAKLGVKTDFQAGWTGLANGTHVKVEGTKTEWAGEWEVADATVTILDDKTWKAEAADLTAAFAKEDELLKHQNELVAFKGVTVVEYEEGKGNGFKYKNDTAGTNDDLYYKVSLNGVTYEFCVESYLMYEGSDTYKAVTELKVGDKINIEGFLYWYNGPNLHTTKVTK